MIETIKEYMARLGLELAAIAAEFGADNYQEAQQWADAGWSVITEKNGAVRIMSPRRVKLTKGDL